MARAGGRGNGARRPRGARSRRGRRGCRRAAAAMRPVAVSLELVSIATVVPGFTGNGWVTPAAGPRSRVAGATSGCRRPGAGRVPRRSPARPPSFWISSLSVAIRSSGPSGRRHRRTTTRSVNVDDVAASPPRRAPGRRARRAPRRPRPHPPRRRERLPHRSSAPPPFRSRQPVDRHPAAARSSRRTASARAAPPDVAAVTAAASRRTRAVTTPLPSSFTCTVNAVSTRHPARTGTPSATRRTSFRTGRVCQPARQSTFRCSAPTSVIASTAGTDPSWTSGDGCRSGCRCRRGRARRGPVVELEGGLAREDDPVVDGGGGVHARVVGLEVLGHARQLLVELREGGGDVEVGAARRRRRRAGW